MQAADFARFKAIITGMAELYQRELSGPLLDAYWISLTDWDLAEFEVAAGQLMKTSEFMPRPVAFNQLRKAGRPTAGESWAEVLNCARRGLPLPCDETLRRAVAAIGGIRTVMMSDVEKTPFLERRFVEHFESIADAQEIREAVPEIAFDRRGLAGPAAAGSLLGRMFPRPGE